VLKHFTIGLLLKPQQQMKNEQAKTFNEIVEVVEKKKKSMKENFTTKFIIHGENKSFFD
jgi:RNAse (barnase) inhibitor barstar